MKEEVGATAAEQGGRSGNDEGDEGNCGNGNAEEDQWVSQRSATKVNVKWTDEGKEGKEVVAGFQEFTPRCGGTWVHEWILLDTLLELDFPLLQPNGS